MRSVAINLALLSFLAVSAGCQQKMADQPSFKPLTSIDFFPDGRSARPAVAGTVARGHLRIDNAFFTGRIGGTPPVPQAAPAQDAAAQPTNQLPGAGPSLAPMTSVPVEFRDNAAFVREFPLTVNEPMIEHGYQRYMIYCVVCHDPLGTGHGRIIERGYTPPPSLHIERLRNAPPGRLFAIVTEGYGSMPSYAGQISPEDRWAIVAYVRALQLSQHFPKEELSAEMLKEFQLAQGRGRDVAESLDGSSPSPNPLPKGEGERKGDAQ